MQDQPTQTPEPPTQPLPEAPVQHFVQASTPVAEQPSTQPVAPEQPPVYTAPETTPAQPATVQEQSPTPFQSPAQPAPNNGQPPNLSAQKLLDDYEKDRDRHDIGKIMVIGCIFMLLGGISLAPVVTWLFLAGPAILVYFANSPAYLGTMVIAVTTVLIGFLLVFRKEIGRVGARIVAVLQLILIAISFISQLGFVTYGSALAGSSTLIGYSVGLMLLGILGVVFYVWVFGFMGKQSVRNLFRA